VPGATGLLETLSVVVGATLSMSYVNVVAGPSLPAASTASALMVCDAVTAIAAV
jgi:hypothetical protein